MGLTLVELLIAAAVAGIILAGVSLLFASQTRTSERVQSTNRANLVARGVGEAIAQDLRMAGARAIVRGTNAEYVDQVVTECGADYASCVKITGTPGSDEWTLTIYYASSLWANPPWTDVTRTEDDWCRAVRYRFDADTSAVFRIDVACVDLESLPANPYGFDNRFADGVVSVGAQFICADDASETPIDDPAACFANAGDFVRSAVVAVQASAGNQFAGGSALTLRTDMPNARVPDTTNSGL